MLAGDGLVSMAEVGFWQTARQGVSSYARGVRASNQAFNRVAATTFAKSYAHGGLTSRLVPVQGLRLESRGLFGGGVGTWSPAYMRNLQKMQAHGGDIGAAASNLLGKAPGKSVTRKSMFRAAPGAVMGTALIAGLPAVLAEGGAGERMAAAAGGVGSEVGARAGGLFGLKAGAALGSSILPGIGSVVGGAIGGLVGLFGGGAAGWGAGQSGFGVLNAVAERGKRARTSNWINDTSAFTTRRAKTMRQASLQMMNSGMMTARNSLGHEGVQLHR